MKAWSQEVVIALVCVCATLQVACSRAKSSSSGSWSPTAAAGYLEQREGWWENWPDSQRDKGTFCISCHTSLSYALSRPALRKLLREKTPSFNERQLLDNVKIRVLLWNTIGPYYGNRGSDLYKVSESRGTESVINALVLVSDDTRSGKLSSATRIAFENMWALQKTEGDETGSWDWLQFTLEPWEARDAHYYGACLAALAVGMAPQDYRSSPEIQRNIQLLRNYLNREYEAQPTLNRIFLLWASARFPGLLAPDQKQLLIGEVLDRQQSDGGWKTSYLAWTWRDWKATKLIKMWLRGDGTMLGGSSDGLATGLVAYVLPQVGVSNDNPQLQRALAWLRHHQQSDGRWLANSLNERRDLTSNTGRFMSDAATAFAVLALTRDESQ